VLVLFYLRKKWIEVASEERKTKKKLKKSQSNKRKHFVSLVADKGNACKSNGLNILGALEYLMRWWSQKAWDHSWSIKRNWLFKKRIFNNILIIKNRIYYIFIITMLQSMWWIFGVTQLEYQIKKYVCFIFKKNLPNQKIFI
jgi:hypothetical protein